MPHCAILVFIMQINCIEWIFVFLQLCIVTNTRWKLKLCSCNLSLSKERIKIVARLNLPRVLNEMFRFVSFLFFRRSFIHSYQIYVNLNHIKSFSEWEMYIFSLRAQNGTYMHLWWGFVFSAYIIQCRTCVHSGWIAETLTNMEVETSNSQQVIYCHS